jgi:hypothetical protein
MENDISSLFKLRLQLIDILTAIDVRITAVEMALTENQPSKDRLIHFRSMAEARLGHIQKAYEGDLSEIPLPQSPAESSH